MVEIGEPIPGIDHGARPWRCSMLARALGAKGHAVTWWASNFDHMGKCDRFSRPCVAERGGGLELRFLPGPGYRRNRSPRRWWHHRRVAAAFAREAARLGRPDVLFCCLPTLELAERSVAYGKQAGVPVLIDIRDLWPDHYLTLAPHWLRLPLRLALIPDLRRARRALRGTDGITAISPSFLEWGLRHAGRGRRPSDGVLAMGYPSAEPPSTVEQERLRAQLAERLGVGADQVLFSFVGTFSSSFDLVTVVRAAAALKERGESRMRFVLAGDGDQAAALRARAARLDNVVFAGWLNEPSIRALLGLSAAGLAPYCVGASMSLPNKPYEYMAAGLPLVSSLPGELEKLLADERIGLHYRADSVEQLAEMVTWLAKHPAERTAMGERARRLFDQRFRADVVYPALVSHLEAVAGQPCPVLNAAGD